ncbi:MAG: pyridoxal-phosphate dependent enzyme, partial [Verrucomicrobia bacterium]|nr:pyridoxal-phosphate dependent enzyme [Verrucomicrobiota bacterium]
VAFARRAGDRDDTLAGVFRTFGELEGGPDVGAGFVPKNCDISLIDEVILVTNEDAFAMAQEVSIREGLAVGISAGANIWAALQLAKRPEYAGKRIVTIACSPSERYLSTALAEKVRAEVTALTAS